MPLAPRPTRQSFWTNSGHLADDGDVTQAWLLRRWHVCFILRIRVYVFTCTTCVCVYVNHISIQLWLNTSSVCVYMSLYSSVCLQLLSFLDPQVLGKDFSRVRAWIPRLTYLHTCLVSFTHPELKWFIPTIRSAGTAALSPDLKYIYTHNASLTLLPAYCMRTQYSNLQRCMNIQYGNLHHRI